MSKPLIGCPHCKGTGVMPLTGIYYETFVLLAKHGPTIGARLAEIAGCKDTAMNNRLSVLENHGLVTSERYGRERRFKVRATASKREAKS